MKQKDIPHDIIAQALNLWRKLAVEEFYKCGDVGSCILGDGISAMVIPNGGRKAREHMLIRAGEIAQCQGSIHYEACKDEVIAFLKENGIDAFYNSGWMD